MYTNNNFSSKFFRERIQEPVFTKEVPIEGSGVPVGPIINNPDVSVEVTPQEENPEVMVDDDEIINADDEIIEPDDEIEGPEGPMINRRKRSLDEVKHFFSPK